MATAEQTVKAAYPEAVALGLGGPHLIVIWSRTGHHPREELGMGYTAAGAWNDAAHKLPGAHTRGGGG